MTSVPNASLVWVLDNLDRQIYRYPADLAMTLLRAVSLPSKLPLVSLVALTGMFCVTAVSTSHLDGERKGDDDEDTTAWTFQIEVNFMDKLARKSYLQFQGGSSTNNVSTTSIQRPAAVPPTLRLLTIDLPEVRRHGFSHGICLERADHVYPDGIALPNKLTMSDKETLLIEQKTYIKSYFECQQQQSGAVGVQVMEANTVSLNPDNLRKTHQFGRLRYDPGKLTNDSLQRTLSVQATAQDEMDAPWNQTAWMQELELRLSGQVEFGSTLERANWWNRLLWGDVYRRSVRGSTAVDDGVHGCSSHKPHAVVANGAALNRVPNALRFLQQTCKKHDVPLYVVQDPRKWNNTHTDIGQVLKDVRRTVKKRIVANSLQTGTAFARGRLVGQMETDAKWKSKEMLRKTRESLRSAEESRKRKEEMDWSGLDESELQNELTRRGVMAKTASGAAVSSTKAMQTIVELLSKETTAADQTTHQTTQERPSFTA